MPAMVRIELEISEINEATSSPMHIEIELSANIVLSSFSSQSIDLELK
jgi:hypothetical protein